MKIGFWLEHRDAVRAALHRRSRTPHWLTKQLAGKLTPSQVYEYLAGKRNLKPKNIRHMSELLGLGWTINEPRGGAEKN